MATLQEQTQGKEGKRLTIRPFDGIKIIDDTKELWKIAVRIVDLWTVVNKSKQEHFEMVFMDAEGDRIQAVIPKDEMGTWKTKLKEGNTYHFENFAVFNNDFQFKVCAHPYKMLFSGGTIMKEKHFPDIPPNQYHFKDFADILSGNYRPDFLVDVIGSLHRMVSDKPHGDLKKVACALKDNSGNVISCTLWGSCAEKFQSYYNQKPKNQQVILILTHARIKEPEGNYPVSVSNAWCGSKLLINEDIPEIEEFKKSLPANDGAESSTQISTQMTAYSQFSDQDRFLYKAQVKSLGEINQLQQETLCVTIGTTGKFIVSKNGWSYEGCRTCTKKAIAVGSQFKCQDGHVMPAPTPRYKLEIRVVDKTDSAKLIFWDQDCQMLIGISAAELMQQMIEAGEDNPKAYPKALDEMLARTLAYRIKVQPGYNQGSVIKTWDDPQMIQKIRDQIQPDEHTSKMDLAKSDVDEDVHIATQSLSATAEHDPDLLNSVTPAKRISSELHLDGKLSDEMTTAQLSSSKITKHIKTE